MRYVAIYSNSLAGWYVFAAVGELCTRPVAGPFKTKEQAEALIDA